MSENIKNSENQKNLSQAPIFDHLLELRSRLIRSLIVFVFGFCMLLRLRVFVFGFCVHVFFCCFSKEPNRRGPQFGAGSW